MDEWENEWAQRPEHSGSQAIFAVTEKQPQWV